MNGATDVLLLGAGFSAAINAELPLANELGNLAFDRAWSSPGQVAGQRRFSVNYPFEVALSLLAEAQPHLTEPANRINYARFAQLSEAVAQVLDDAQSAAFTQRAPTWLFELLSVLHQRQSTVVTLNYDTALETGVETHWLIPEAARPVSPNAPALERLAATGAAESRVLAADILRNRPSPPGGSSNGSSYQVKSMQLLKLHGSIDWWWVPGDLSGVSLAREGVYGTFGTPRRLSEQERRDQFPGRERFIVPPLATKSPYYAYPLTRQLWQDAYEALKQAQRVALVGYSLPVTDFVTSGMLQAAIQGRDVVLDIVNRDVAALESRLRALVGVGEADDLPHWVHVYSGDRCVEDYSRLLAEEQAEVAAESMRHQRFSSQEVTLHVAWPVPGGEVSRKVFSASGPDEHGTMTLRTAEVADARVNSAKPFDPPPEQDHPTLASISSALSGARRIVVIPNGGEPANVVRVIGNTNWVRLIPATLLQR